MADIPTIYRIHYTWVDPLISFASAISCFTSPEVMLDAWIPKEISPYNPDHYVVYWVVGLLFGMLAVHEAVLLRYSADIVVWKILLFPILLVDIFLLSFNYICFREQGRTDPANWRGVDWASVIITAACVVSRGLFIAGVGLNSQKVKLKK